MSQPEILNLDEVELPQSRLAITHKGQTHSMRTITVEDFIAQQQRAKQVDEKSAEAEADGQDVAEVGDVVRIIRDQIGEMFPTLPVGELEVPKLFTIFSWLRTVTAQINQANAPAEAEAEPSAEGNAEAQGE